MKQASHRLRYPLFACSVLAGVLGCWFFPLGGFLLLPVALDLWDHATEDPVSPELMPVRSKSPHE